MSQSSLWQCIKTNRDTKIFETGIETLDETKYFKSITCISLENDISIAKTFFETKIFETDTETFFPNIRDRYRDFFRDQNFRDRYQDFFSRANIFETNIETFFETKYF